MPLWMIIVRQRPMMGGGMPVYQFLKVIECTDATWDDTYTREAAPLMIPYNGPTPYVFCFDRQPPLPWEEKNEKMPMVEVNRADQTV